MGCRFPGAPNLEAFWKLLCEGVDAIAPLPADRFDLDEWYAEDRVLLEKRSHAKEDFYRRSISSIPFSLGSLPEKQPSWTPRCGFCSK